jgi:cytochrome c oxidase subunit II
MLGLPPIASAHGYEIDQMIYIVHGLMLLLFVGWGIFFITALIKFNRRNNPVANYEGVKSHISGIIEIAVVGAEILLLAAFSIPFWAKQVNAFPDRPDALNIRVVAEQFAWNVHYPGVDGKFGKTSPKLIDQQNNPLGINTADPDAQDDFSMVNQLHVPVGHPIIIHLSSKDVIHSFSIPVMRVKQDALPGMRIKTWFIPTKTGQWEIACAQLCGIGHYRMKGFITVHSDKDYDAWVASQATVGKAGESSGDSFWN